MYEYKAELVRVVDGDTVYLKVDLGFHITTVQSFRLRGIDTPEIRGSEREAGLVAKAVITDLLAEGQITVKTTKTGKYGRWIGTLYVDDGVKTIDVNEEMVRRGLAERYPE